MQAQAQQVTTGIDKQKLAQTLGAGLRGFEVFKRGLATGAWEEFLNLTANDFEMYSPIGQYKGLHQGKMNTRAQ
jgi:hypothetical protein